MRLGCGTVTREMSGTDELVAALRRAARSLVLHSNLGDRDGLLGDIVAAGVSTVAGADGGGLSRVEADKVRSSHATDAFVGELDRLQSELGQGPCLTAAYRCSRGRRARGAVGPTRRTKLRRRRRTPDERSSAARLRF